jgi:hypothetical protein
MTDSCRLFRLLAENQSHGIWDFCNTICHNRTSVWFGGRDDIVGCHRTADALERVNSPTGSTLMMAAWLVVML